MAGAFPREPTRHRDRPLVDACPALDVFELRRCGALAPGAVTTLEVGERGSLRAVREAGKITIGDQAIAIRPHAHLAVEVFGCPTEGCGRDCYRLHYVEGRWRCRLDEPRLDYACRHRNLTIVGYARALALRRRLGASPQLFSPVEVSLRSRARLRLAIELRAIEGRLADLVASNATVIEKRHDSKRRRRQGQPHF